MDWTVDRTTIKLHMRVSTCFRSGTRQYMCRVKRVSLFYPARLWWIQGRQLHLPVHMKGDHSILNLMAQVVRTPSRNTPARLFLLPLQTPLKRRQRKLRLGIYLGPLLCGRLTLSRHCVTDYVSFYDREVEVIIDLTLSQSSEESLMFEDECNDECKR